MVMVMMVVVMVMYVIMVMMADGCGDSVNIVHGNVLMSVTLFLSSSPQCLVQFRLTRHLHPSPSTHPTSHPSPSTHPTSLTHPTSSPQSADTLRSLSPSWLRHLSLAGNPFSEGLLFTPAATEKVVVMYVCMYVCVCMSVCMSVCRGC